MTEYVVWGFNGSYQRTPIKLTGGNLQRCRRETHYWARDGWTCATYLVGTAPEGLRDQARATLKAEAA